MLDPIQPMAAALNPIPLDWPGIQNSGQTFQQFSRDQIISCNYREYKTSFEIS